MLPPKMIKLLQKTRYKCNYEMRAIAAYYASKPHVHPNPSETDSIFIPNSSTSKEYKVLHYIRLAERKQTLAVFRVTNKSALKRLKRWPRSIDDGTAVTLDMLNQWASEADDGLDALLDELDGLTPPEHVHGAASRYGVSQ